jgi:hypothetical protein
MIPCTHHATSQLEKLFSIPPPIGPKRPLGPRPKSEISEEQNNNENTTEKLPSNDDALATKNVHTEQQLIPEPISQPSESSNDNETEHKPTESTTKEQPKRHEKQKHHTDNKNQEHKKRKKEDNAEHARSRKKTKMFEPVVISCKFYREGRCTKGAECSFAHNEINKKADLCKFFLIGACQKGDECIYSHNPSQFPCKYFHVTNNCKMGDECKFSHVELTDLQRELLDHQLKIGDSKKEEPVPIAPPPLPVNPFASTLFDSSTSETILVENPQPPVVQYKSVFDV